MSLSRCPLWLKKFNEPASNADTSWASQKPKGKICDTYVKNAMVYGSETLPMKKEERSRLERAEHTMIQRICGVTLRDRVPGGKLYSRLCVDSISSIVAGVDFVSMGMYSERMTQAG